MFSCVQAGFIIVSTILSSLSVKASNENFCCTLLRPITPIRSRNESSMYNCNIASANFCGCFSHNNPVELFTMVSTYTCPPMAQCRNARYRECKANNLTCQAAQIFHHRLEIVAIIRFPPVLVCSLAHAVPHSVPNFPKPVHRNHQLLLNDNALNLKQVRHRLPNERRVKLVHDSSSVHID
ncbi:unnamed protein product [Ceratitis capitata]|uniref:(Mediterranean fruit fly) hypothetical protein n=1 Tax=Ceratitis capitata TaxID=7213 RepID=A0A811V1H1_CERCA|nr:unnamed protein product [Ceratitis capitata]